jgi:hypothetical protein
MEFTSACVVGAGRVGTAVSARLSESMPTRLTGRELEVGDADLVVLAVPDRAVDEVAAAIPAGPWVAHTSGARTLDALDPHVRRFSIHPLQTIVRDRGPEQLDGAWAAVTGESEEALGAAFRLADCCGSAPSSCTTRTGSSTTPPRSWPRASSSRSTGPRPSSSPRRAPRRPRFSRSCSGRWTTTSS